MKERTGSARSMRGKLCKKGYAGGCGIGVKSVGGQFILWMVTIVKEASTHVYYHVRRARAIRGGESCDGVGSLNSRLTERRSR